MKAKAMGASVHATTKTTTYNDGKFVRTAIVVGGDEENTGSIDLVDADGARLAQVNISFLPDSDGLEVLIVDVIDVDNRYTNRRMLAFTSTERVIKDAPGRLVSVDFRRPIKSDTCASCGMSRASHADTAIDHAFRR